MSLGDIALFLRGARTDRTIRATQDSGGSRVAFETIYSTLDDPWLSADRRYRYQKRKYSAITSVLPKGRCFGRTLDLGCGLGLLSQSLARHSDDVLGMDIAQSAIDRARIRANGVANLRFSQGDLTALPASLDGSFDLVVLADTLYYLPRPTSDLTLEAAASRVGALLAPGGLCLLANHYFAAFEGESRLSLRIHRAFRSCAGLQPIVQQRRPFYLLDLLGRVAEPGPPARTAS